MDYEQARDYLFSLPEATQTEPFGEDVLVLKVRHKMFVTLTLRDDFGHMNLKCDPDEALALRDLFDAVMPGYHMNKKHWNTVVLDGSIPEADIKRMIDHSYLLVVSGLMEAEQEDLRARNADAPIWQ